MGLRKIVTWLLDVPLIVPIVVVGILLFAACGWASGEAKASLR